MKALEVSNIILTHFDYIGDLITNKKLQKLLYYVEAWSLVYHSSLIEEDFEAWVHGPVIPEVYQQFKSFGYSAIKNEYSDGQTASDKMRNLLKSSNLEKEQKDLIFAVLHKYSSLTSFQLESLSHSEQPWLEARKGLMDFDHSSVLIDKRLMKSYYSSLVNVQE
ncbi:MAG: DUF4065 domain-containing protein [Saprospiraceae bacterium]|nr:DUF4065 domain-containing protein [Candidatus Defluviibacterium haderslevense]